MRTHRTRHSNSGLFVVQVSFLKRAECGLYDYGNETDDRPDEGLDDDDFDGDEGGFDDGCRKKKGKREEKGALWEIFVGISNHHK